MNTSDDLPWHDTMFRVFLLTLPLIFLYYGIVKSVISKKQAPWVFGLLLIAVAVGFFAPMSRNEQAASIIKGVLYILVFVLLYGVLIWPEKETGPAGIPGTEKKSGIAEKVHLPEESGDSVWRGFGEAFQWYYRGFLTIIRNASVASAVALYLKKGQNVFEFQGGDTASGPVTQKLLVQEGSLIEIVARQRKSFLEGKLPIGVTMPGIPGFQIRSFIGVPMIRENEVTGVLAMGSEAMDNFSEQDQELLEKCGQLFMQVMVVYRKGLRWEMDEKIYRLHLDLERQLENNRDEQSILLAFVDVMKKMFPFSRLTFCEKDGNQGVVRWVYGQLDDYNQGARFNLDDGLNGWILKRNAPMIVEDITGGEVTRPRYEKGESHEHGLHSFMGIPMADMDDVWGCLTLESPEPGQYDGTGQQVFASMSLHLKSALERIRLMRQIQKLAESRTAAGTARFQME